MHACKETYIDKVKREGGIFSSVACRLNLTFVAVKIRPKLDKTQVEEFFLNPALSFLQMLPPSSPKTDIYKYIIRST